MFGDLGYLLLLFAFVLSLYGVVSSLLASFLRHRKLWASAKIAATCVFLLTLSASILLLYLFFTGDYSVSYVFKNSSDDLPRFYRWTAFWSALEGSHFLWTLLLTLYSFIAHWTYAKDNEPLMPFVSATLQGILGWMLYLALTYCDPFAPQFPRPQAGLGMNPLLQNPYMAFHPPSLFTGYTALAIPFAYSVAALAYGDITEGWLRSVRRWALYAWSFLTIGVFLGGRWAYVELGWGGYWAWDPVENSSFMPWLFATGLLHSLIIQDKLGHLKRLSLTLAFFAFFFSFFGTFITRSGIITSVHSFAQSPIGPNYLGFLGVLMGGGALLYGFKAPGILPPDTQKAWGVSRESALVITQFLLTVFICIIFVGTIYPILSETITGNRFHVQAPYFNTFAPFIGFAFVLAITIGNLLRFGSPKLAGGKKGIVLSLLFALPLSLVFAYFGDVFQSQGKALIMQLIGFWLSFWAILSLTLDLSVRIQTLGNLQLFFSKNLSYLGAYLAHLGVIFAVIGFLGNYRGMEQVVTLKKGEVTKLFGYEFEFSGIGIEQEENVELYTAPLRVSKDGKYLGLLRPARAKYPTKNELLHEIGIQSSFWHDLYAVLSDFDPAESDRATIQLHINPTVKLVWISCLFMVLGGIVALMDRFRGRRSRDSTLSSWA